MKRLIIRMTLIDDVTGQGRYRDLEIHPDDLREDKLEQINETVADATNAFVKSILLHELSPIPTDYFKSIH